MLTNNSSVDYKPNAEIFAGSDIDKVGSKISMWSSTDQKGSGLSYLDMYAYSYTSNAINAGANAYMGMDDEGVKIGVIKAPDLQYDGYNGIVSPGGLHVDTYYLPKVLPTTGQVLGFDSSTTNLLGRVTARTKWTNLLTINANPATPESTFASATAVGGDFYAKDAGTGLILTSPNGTKFKITVNDDGSLNSTKVNAPTN
jgi:hypothetical protein